jgi:predicted AAA+ superfamily ATPase
VRRNLRPVVEEALDSFRGVVLTGARQAGKSTLARDVCARRRGTYVSLDDETALEAALRDPVGFVDRPPPVAIDEVQRGGDALLRAIKARMDARRGRGAFLLTGSTRFLSLPRLSESLAGRIEVLDLWPFSQGELDRRRDGFADRLFGPAEAVRGMRVVPASREAVAERICRGGFPEVQRLRPAVRRRWFAAYVRTVTQRDVLEASRLRQIEELPRLLRLLAARTAQEMNVQHLSSDLGMPRTTLLGYLAAVEVAYLWHRLPAWSRNLTAKVVRHPKGFITDTGLASYLLGAEPGSLLQPQGQILGPLLENFVLGEMARQRGWTHVDHDLFHFRDRSGPEVDLVLEARDGRVAAIETKAAATVSGRDFAGIDLLHDRLGDAFAHGVVLHLGDAVQPFGDRRTALPVAALWAG